MLPKSHALKKVFGKVELYQSFFLVGAITLDENRIARVIEDVNKTKEGDADITF